MNFIKKYCLKKCIFVIIINSMIIFHLLPCVPVEYITVPGELLKTDFKFWFG